MTSEKATLYDVAIVPGGGIAKGGSLPLWVRTKLDMAAEIFQENETDLILMSGGGKSLDDFPVTEADGMKKYCTDIGIPAERILTEPESRNTIANAYNSRRLHTDPRALRRPIVIENAFHLQRSKACFDWVLDKWSNTYHIEYQEVPDDGIGDTDLRTRRQTEAALIDFYRNEIFKGIAPGDMDAIGAFLELYTLDPETDKREIAQIGSEYGDSGGFKSILNIAREYRAFLKEIQGRGLSY